MGWVGGGLLLAAVVAAGLAALALHRAEPYLRARIVEGLRERFHARVELDEFHVSLMSGLRAEGKGLRIWPPARVEGVAVPAEPAGADEAEPLVRLAEFRFHAPLRYEPGKPIHVSVVELNGLSVHLPPRSHFEHAAAAIAKPKSPGPVTFEVDTLECNAAELVVETSKPGKVPLSFAIARLRLTRVSSGAAMGVDAELTNPRPHGLIHSTGTFGPWQAQDPGEIPLAGDYRFDHADLGDFKGIAGILSSTGHYQGTLRDLTVDGQTDTPDFRLTHFGTALPLKTRFHAKVDGTNGDTWLDPVDATLGQSHFTAQGQIVRVLSAEPGTPPHSIGHDIALTVNVDKARIEDFLRLASRSGAVLMTGDVTLKTALHIPPGPAHVHERLSLNGHFALDRIQFTSAKIQGRVEELSRRGLGRAKDQKPPDAAAAQSHMDGRFTLAGGLLTLPSLEYTVPGARIDLKGAYGLEGGTLDFAGTARLDATVSQMVGGWKGILLKPADRFFRKDGAGTMIPVHIQGTREQPVFGVEFGGFKVDAKR
jgi:hypothetical protein